MEFEEQFDDEHAILARLEKSQSLASEWATNLTTSVAAANGAGLISLGGYLTSSSLGKGFVLLGLAAALIFLAGLVASAAGTSAAHYGAIFETERFRRRYLAIKTKEQDRFSWEVHLDEAVAKSRTAERWCFRVSILNFAAGFLLALILIGGVAWKSNRELTKPELERCAQLKARLMSSKTADATSAEVYRALSCSEP